MNKPKIYGFCQAGCKWETVHKTDFDNSVTYIKQTAIDGVYYLDPIANYKIYSGVQSNAYTCQIKLAFKKNSLDYDYTFNISEFDNYRTYIYFEILSLRATSTLVTVVYEVNGNRYVETISGTNIDISNATLKISANEVLKYNPDADITVDYNILKLTNISIASNKWTEDTTYIGYGYSYRASISVEGVTSEMVSEVTFGCNEALSGNYAPVCETYDGGIYIYSKVNTAINIPSVLVVK
jgi:hypothetical protein